MQKTAFLCQSFFERHSVAPVVKLRISNNTHLAEEILDKAGK